MNSFFGELPASYLYNMYLVTSPSWLRWLAGNDLLWQMPDNGGKKMYLTFDDGPHPTITPAVLDLLQTFNAKASFFCIGKNVTKYPAVYQRIIAEGHAVGNHTFNHLNGWKTTDEVYLDDIRQAGNYIDSTLFRPPYGRITKFQNYLVKEKLQLKTVMWNVLSGDFDVQISADQCVRNVIKHAKSGSIVVFHDSEKAWTRLEKALPVIMDFFSKQGYQFEKI